ncbi:MULTISPECIES: 3-oxoacyl-[acyl-carrier-protein] reductase [Bacillus cereus group]|uniref:3-oxoacyl-[acyl-carrier-protein] reductase n=1 Tax=Bacillus cereus group TaxID=86661 RepID=UPI00156B6CC2|nr:3-oxoacyl-[acyl-carrier-protein] reductase [Bacillus cereus]MDA2491372.1 3-oxoacyl-[acyl-carrier-protein] reductase [Bacillus cereus]MDZ4621215.1 3-oxoacyl-[acyl-carrier-protein] reductase [Bacillus cereus]NRS81698.1 3-oxoacyl-[acyl-carrier-protein] reductase [Bacillus cereus]
MQKVALVTGGSKGIGSSVVEKLAEDGYLVILHYFQSEESARTLQKHINSLNYAGNVVCMKANLCDELEVIELISNIIEKYKKIDILVNNAGITKDNLIVRMTKSDFDLVMDTNLTSVFITSKLAAKVMIKQRQGKIINMSSVSGLSGNAGQTNYSASKAGIIGFTKALAKELGKKNIQVNAVAPGFIISDMTDSLPENIRDEYLKQIPLNRFGSKQDVAEMVAFLASKKSDYITGQVFTVDGGLNM